MEDYVVLNYVVQIVNSSGIQRKGILRRARGNKEGFMWEAEFELGHEG